MKDNTNEKSLQVIHHTIFYKIKNFFKKFFSRKVVVEEESKNITSNPNSNISNDKKAFFNSLKFDSHLIELQKKLKLGEITVQDLSEQEKDDMIELYQKQINEKKSKLKYLKEKIISYRKNMTNH